MRLVTTGGRLELADLEVLDPTATECACCEQVPTCDVVLIEVETRSVELPAASLPICADCLSAAVAIRLAASQAGGQG